MRPGAGVKGAARAGVRAAARAALLAAARAALLAAAVLAVAAASAFAAGANVTTAAYNNLRDDWDAAEPGLAPSAVQSGSFGELFSTTVSGSVYAQPLVYEGDVIVTTEKADAYAINASTGAIVWKRSFGKPMKASTIGCSDLTPNLGSTSTPVIDPSTGTIYITTRLLEGGHHLANSHWYLQAISAASGEERPGFPVKIAGTPANTPGVEFNEHYSQQRPGLLLLNGVVYIAFASDCDITPYRGIVVGVNAGTGAITTMWSDEAGSGADESSQAGIWQSGGGLVSDLPGRIILTTGNGVSPSPAPSNAPPETLSESVVALTVGAGGELTPTDFFAPSNAPELDAGDVDLGSGGPIALPTEYFGTIAIPHLLVQVGKDGRIFLINADEMGGYRQGPEEGDAVLQTLGPFDGVWGHPAAYGGQGGWVYVLESAGGGYLRALSYGLGGEGQPALTSQGTSNESFGYTSGSPLVTSDGTAAGSAVVWVEYSDGPSGGHAQLRAYSAIPNEGTLPLLWAHSIGKASKFGTPTAAEGRVYVGTRNGHLIAFGSSGAAPLQAAPVEVGSIPVGQSKSATVTVSASREVKITSPITAGGEQSVAGPQPSSALIHRLTAGPKSIPPSGSASLQQGVITVQQPRPGSAIAAGAALHIRVSLRPRHAGPIVGEVVVHTSAGARAVTVTGYATRPGLLLSAPPLAFGEIRTHAEGKTLSVTFSNSWDRRERLIGYRLPALPYHVSGLPPTGTTLAPRQSVTISVHFEPTRPGSYRAQLTLLTDHGAATATATGTALAGTPRLAVSTEEIDFGSVPLGSSRSRTFYVRDGGNVPVTVSRAIAPTEPFGASVPLSEGITIEPGVQARVTVTFRPLVRGPASGLYLLNAQGSSGYLRVRLTGRGT